MHAQEKATGLVAKRRYSVDVPLQHLMLLNSLPSLANVRIPVSVAQIEIQSCG